MIALEPPFRLARTEDAAVLARLTNDAGEGLPLHFWTGMAGEGEDPWAVGARRTAEAIERGRTMVVADEGEGPIAGLVGYPIGPDPVPVDELPAMIRPLQVLENRAPDSWYVNILAALPAARGKGYGTRLLGIAERLAAAEGKPRMSVIAADANVGARRLYERAGYAERARAAMVKDGWTSESEAWVLLVKELR